MLFQLSTCKSLKINGIFCGNMLEGSITTESQKLEDIFFFPEFISKNLALVDQVENHIAKNSFQTEKIHLCQNSKNCNICKATKFHNDAGTVS